MTKVQRTGHQVGLIPTSGSLSEEQSVLEALSERMSAHRGRTTVPFVTLSYSQSLDGSIATNQGKPMRLSSPQSMALTHELRGIHDAILVGIGTVLADNPRLNVRLAEGEDPQPVVVDSKLRFPLEGNLLRNHSRFPWIATTDGAGTRRRRRLEGAGARVLSLPANESGSVNLAALLEMLGQLGIGSVMVEGGARIITSFLSLRLVNYLVLTVAPVLVGGLPAVDSLGPRDRSRYPRLLNTAFQRLGDDLILWGDPTWDEA